MASNYIDEIATSIYRVNDPEGEISADDMVLYRIYAVLALTKGMRAEPRDVHQAWAAWRSGNFPGHPDLIPFEQLSPEKKGLDQTFVDAIHAVARQERNAVPPITTDATDRYALDHIKDEMMMAGMGAARLLRNLITGEPIAPPTGEAIWAATLTLELLGFGPVEKPDGD